MEDTDLYTLAVMMKEKADKSPLDISKHNWSAPELETVFLDQGKYGVVLERIQRELVDAYCLHIVNYSKPVPPSDSVCQKIIRIFLGNANEVGPKNNDPLRQFLKSIEFSC